MSIEKNVQIVKNFLAALGGRDKQGLLALVAEDIEWIIPGEDWPLAGTHRGHAGLQNVLQKANETVETSYPEPPEFIAQGDRVLVVGFATGKIKATNKTFEDHWVFDITVRNGKVTKIRSISTRRPWRGPPRCPLAPGADLSRCPSRAARHLVAVMEILIGRAVVCAGARQKLKVKTIVPGEIKKGECETGQGHGLPQSKVKLFC